MPSKDEIQAAAKALRGEVERVLRPMVGTRDCPPLPIYPGTGGEQLVREAWHEVLAAALREGARLRVNAPRGHRAYVEGYLDALAELRGRQNRLADALEKGA